MESLREIYRIGPGPSSSHTMGPERAARAFLARYPGGAGYRVTLYGSLAATGRGHLTDVALERAFQPRQVELVWKPDVVHPFHPNGMDFEAFEPTGKEIARWRVYSVGGGALREENAPPPASVYPLSTMADILAWCGRSSMSSRRGTVWSIESSVGLTVRSGRNPSSFSSTSDLAPRRR